MSGFVKMPPPPPWSRDAGRGSRANPQSGSRGADVAAAAAPGPEPVADPSTELRSILDRLARLGAGEDPRSLLSADLLAVLLRPGDRERAWLRVFNAHPDREAVLRGLAALIPLSGEALVLLSPWHNPRVANLPEAAVRSAVEAALRRYLETVDALARVSLLEAQVVEAARTRLTGARTEFAALDPEVMSRRAALEALERDIAEVEKALERHHDEARRQAGAREAAERRLADLRQTIAQVEKQTGERQAETARLGEEGAVLEQQLAAWERKFATEVQAAREAQARLENWREELSRLPAAGQVPTLLRDIQSLLDRIQAVLPPDAVARTLGAGGPGRGSARP